MNIFAGDLETDRIIHGILYSHNGIYANKRNEASNIQFLQKFTNRIDFFKSDFSSVMGRRKLYLTCNEICNGRENARLVKISLDSTVRGM